MSLAKTRMANGDYMIDEILRYLGLIGVGAGTAATLTYMLITHRLNKDIASYKTQLKLESDLALERAKNDLRIQSIAFEKKTGLLAEKRALIVAELFKKIGVLTIALSKLTSEIRESGPLSTKYNETFRDAFWDLAQCLSEVDVFLSDEASRLVFTLMKSIHAQLENANKGTDSSPEDIAAYKEARTQAVEVQKQLRRELRAMVAAE